LSGGGTAGHIYPALAVAEELSAGGRDEVLFVGTPDGPEARLVPGAGVPFSALSASGFDRARPWTLVTSSVQIAASAVRAIGLLGRYGPDAVVGFGGYVSIPVGFAAVARGVPLVLHEQNSVPGLANRVLSRWARRVALTYPEASSALRSPERAVVTGNPVRPGVIGATRERGKSQFGAPPDALLLLAFGGSRGARHINSALLALRGPLLSVPGLRVVQVAGPAEAESVRAALAQAGGDGGGRWQVLDYVDDMGSGLAAADLVLARAGATSLAEITVLGCPALLVPYPYATDDHQTRNAASLLAAGAAEVISDADLDTPRFGDTLLRLLSDAEARATMAAASKSLGRPDAALRVAELAREAATGASSSD